MSNKLQKKAKRAAARAAREEQQGRKVVWGVIIGIVVIGVAMIALLTTLG